MLHVALPKELARKLVEEESRYSHPLLEVDPYSKEGFCPLCGYVKLKWVGNRRIPVCPNGDYANSTRGLPKKVKKLCSRCGFKPQHPCQLDIHHRNRNHQDNDPDNLEVICANCHRLEHAQK